MKSTTETNLTRPSVEVKLPQIRLSLKDLAYLRSLSQDKSAHCHPGSSTLDRLRFLDLIARAKVPRSPEILAKLKKEKEEALADLRANVIAESWNAVVNNAFTLRDSTRRMEPSEEDVLTEKGKQLLATGEATVKVRKVGCV